MRYRNAQSVVEPEHDQEVFGVLSAFAATLIGLTIIEAVMILVNRSALPVPAKTFAVRFGELLFIPAVVWLFWMAKTISLSRRVLVVATCLTTGHLLISQFRGSWMWVGTFDAFQDPKTPWLRAGVIGIFVGAITWLMPAKVVRTGREMLILIVALICSVIAAAFLPRYFPNETSFVATRAIPLAVGAIVISLVWWRTID